MWIEATKVAIMGFSVVFLTLAILAGRVKVMSLVCKRIQKKGGK
jgi:Na+-transporting methylmalonyl-CoA/oxaloacetate decarboxylase gamma subunit